MISGALRGALLVFALAVCQSAWAGSSLQHDPFARPALAAPAPVNSARADSWNPRLNALLMAGDDSLVTVNGAIVGMGEKVDGYRLVRVGDGVAVFSKGKTHVILRMDVQAAPQNMDRGRQ